MHKPPEPNEAVATPDTYRTTLGSIRRNWKSPKLTFRIEKFALLVFFYMNTEKIKLCMLRNKWHKVTQNALGCLAKYAVPIASLSVSETCIFPRLKKLEI